MLLMEEFPPAASNALVSNLMLYATDTSAIGCRCSPNCSPLQDRSLVHCPMGKAWKRYTAMATRKNSAMYWGVAHHFELVTGSG